MSSRTAQSPYNCSSTNFDRSPQHQNAGNAPILDAAAVMAAAELINKQNVQANATLEPPVTIAPDSQVSTASSTAASTPRLADNNIQFRSQTIAPSPPAPRSAPSSTWTAPPPARSSPDRLHPTNPISSTESQSGLFTPSKPSNRPSLTLQHKTSASSLKPISRTPSLKTYSVFGTASATSSAYPSPVISAMGDVTPLPSPLLSSDSPGPWKRLGRRSSRDGSVHHASDGTHSSPEVPMNSTPTKRKAYPGLSVGTHSEASDSGRRAQDQDRERHQQHAASHTRNRSISEYTPDPMLMPKRMVTVSGSHVKNELEKIETAFESHMRREPHLSEARGITPIEKPPPTPPLSESSSSVHESSGASNSGSSIRSSSKSSPCEYFEAYGRHDRKRRRWRSIKLLGQGTFSRVMLATSQVSSASDDEEYSSAAATSGLQTPEPTIQYDRKTLVAVKVCEHGPRGGASEDRIEMSLKRELEIMQSIRHPSLVHLKAWNIEPTRAILVLSYCPGGDLFDLATRHAELVTPGLLRRMFSELVGAVSYLHEQRIVHRDIKLENVLVNLPASELCSTTTNWTSYPYSIITLTDLGLSRRIADGELLTTRCGSDDYAAPEVIMGSRYDGRATDAWSLGVLLYTLLELRLPFDPLPHEAKMRTKTPHRIARVEWRWYEYGVREGEGEGDHEADPQKFDAKGLRGAMEVVEGLLRRARTRLPLTQVAEMEWVAGGITVEGGIRFREEEEGEEVL